MNKLEQAVNYIKNKTDLAPEIALVLGSGLGAIADDIENPIKIDYKDIPGFPQARVEGHAGCLILGMHSGKKVIAMQGRFHFYEGHPMETVIFPIQVMKALGADKLIVTNAAGGVNTSFDPGNLMIITDHINAFGTNPLIGENNPELGTRFPDMSQVYTPEFIQIAESTAKELNINIKKGVYYGTTGPSYETPAEIRMIRTLGGDAVGMSTVPEVISASHMRMKVLGISCITNMASGILNQPLNHQEVIDTANRIKKDFMTLMKQIINKIN